MVARWVNHTDLDGFPSMALGVEGTVLARVFLGDGLPTFIIKRRTGKLWFRGEIETRDGVVDGDVIGIAEQFVAMEWGLA